MCAFLFLVCLADTGNTRKGGTMKVEEVGLGNKGAFMHCGLGCSFTLHSSFAAQIPFVRYHDGISFAAAKLGGTITTAVDVSVRLRC